MFSLLAMWMCRMPIRWWCEVKAVSVRGYRRAHSHNWPFPSTPISYIICMQSLQNMNKFFPLKRRHFPSSWTAIWKIWWNPYIRSISVFRYALCMLIEYFSFFFLPWTLRFIFLFDSDFWKMWIEWYSQRPKDMVRENVRTWTTEHLDSFWWHFHCFITWSFAKNQWGFNLDFDLFLAEVFNWDFDSIFYGNRLYQKMPIVRRSFRNLRIICGSRRLLLLETKFEFSKISINLRDTKLRRLIC